MRSPWDILTGGIVIDARWRRVEAVLSLSQLADGWPEEEVRFDRFMLGVVVCLYDLIDRTLRSLQATLRTTWEASSGRESIRVLMSIQTGYFAS